MKTRIYECKGREIKVPADVPNSAIHLHLIKEVQKQSTRKAKYLLEDYNKDLSYFTLVDKDNSNFLLIFNLKQNV